MHGECWCTVKDSLTHHSQHTPHSGLDGREGILTYLTHTHTHHTHTVAWMYTYLPHTPHTSHTQWPGCREGTYLPHTHPHTQHTHAYTHTHSGLDVERVLTYLNVTTSSTSKGASTFAIAYVLHKVMLPLRAAVTLGGLPLVVRGLRSMGWMKPRNKG